MITGLYYIPAPEDDEYVESIVSPLSDFVRFYGYEELKERLWELAKAVLSSSDKMTDIDYHHQTIIILKKMISGAWRCLDYMKREKYVHPSFFAEWTTNPFVLRETDRDAGFINRNIHYLKKQGDIKQLSEKEVKNFPLAIQHFFEKLNVLDWLDLLDKWAEYLTKFDSIYTECWDERPLTTYEELLKLIEVTFIVNDFLENYVDEDILSYNNHLYDAEFAVTKVDAINTDVYNPLEHINWIMGQYSSTELKVNLDYWFDCAIDNSRVWDKGEPGELVDFHDTIVRLYEAGWLLTQGKRMPKKWLDPNCFNHYECPKENHQQEYILTLKQRANVNRTLSILYKRVGLGLTRSCLAEALSYALQTKVNPYNSYGSVRLKIKKVIEILDIINRNVCLLFAE